MIDLHCHTSISDGSLSLPEIIKEANDRGISFLAITDHDTTKGVVEASRIGKELGISVIAGIEISAYDFKRNRRAHILGYHILPDHPAIEKLCRPLIEGRQQNSSKMVEILRHKGYQITWEQVLDYTEEEGTGVYKQHIMHALMDSGYCEEIEGELYQELFSRGEKGRQPGIAHIPMHYVDVIDAIHTVVKAGGVPVLAHPGQFDNYDAIPQWVEEGLMGIEKIHPAHQERDDRLIDELALKYRLICTGGSDFHGLYGNPAHYLGLGYEQIQVNVINELEKLRDIVRGKFTAGLE
jgi:predicted metal-dependent phosphoesterase TrpH